MTTNELTAIVEKLQREIELLRERVKAMEYGKADRK